MEKVEPIKLKDCLLSAAIGDICGSPWEFAPFKGLTLEGFRKSIKFDYSDPNNNGYSPLLEHCNMEILRLPHPPYATDDSICTFAIAEAVINGTDIEKKADGSKLVVTLAGRLDTVSAPQLEGELDLAGVEELVFDVGGVDYVSSAGLRLFLAAQKTMAKQGSMSILGAQRVVREVFDMTGLSGILNIG